MLGGGGSGNFYLAPEKKRLTTITLYVPLKYIYGALTGYIEELASLRNCRVNFLQDMVLVGFLS